MNELTATAQVRVKICGMTRLPDAIVAAKEGADFLGYVIYPKSSRHLEPEAVRALTSELRSLFPAILHVGVMVDVSADEAARIVELGGLDLAQLHGGETPETVAALRARGVPVIKALRFGSAAKAPAWSEFDPDYFLCDTFHPTAAGGTGELFDHSLLPVGLPRDRMFLAGGLTPENVASAVAQVAPFAVDVSSGVEKAPGIKRPDAISSFLRAARRSEA